MPDPITTTVEVEGEEVEVELDPSEYGLISEDEVQSRVHKAARNAAKGKYALDEIPESDEVLDALAQSDDALDRLRGLRPDVFRNGTDGDPDAGKLEEKLEEHRKAWEAKHKKPLEKTIEQLEGRVTRLVRDRKDRDVRAALQETGVRDDKGTREMLREVYLGKTRYSAEHDATFLVDEDGDFIPSGDGDQPFLTVEADLAQKREDDGYGSWFADQTKSGTNFGGPGTGEATGGWRSKGKTQMTDAEKRQAIRELIEQHGRPEGRAKWRDWPLRK